MKFENFTRSRNKVWNSLYYRGEFDFEFELRERLSDKIYVEIPYFQAHTVSKSPFSRKQAQNGLKWAEPTPYCVPRERLFIIVFWIISRYKGLKLWKKGWKYHFGQWHGHRESPCDDGISQYPHHCDLPPPAN